MKKARTEQAPQDEDLSLEKANFGTKAIHAGRHLEVGDPLGGSIVLSSNYVLPQQGEGELDYARVGNPNSMQVARKVAALEGAKHCEVFGSGIAAITALTHTLSTGDRILAEENTYGCTIREFSRMENQFGVEAAYIDLSDPKNYKAIEEYKPKIVWIESPTNPMLKVLDIKAIAEVAHKVGAILVVDNTFASSYFQSPLELGADISLISLTKYHGGHSNAMGGALCTNSDEIQETLQNQSQVWGLHLSPMDAYQLEQGMKTMKMRMETHARNAQEFHAFLENYGSPVKWARYPFAPSHPQYELAKSQMTGGSGVVTVEFDMSKEQTLQFIQRLTESGLFYKAHSLGGVESLVSHPATQSHADVPEEDRLRAGITDGVVRFSVGVEDVQDLIRTVDEAIKAVTH